VEDRRRAGLPARLPAAPRQKEITLECPSANNVAREFRLYLNGNVLDLNLFTLRARLLTLDLTTRKRDRLKTALAATWRNGRQK
jgi:hypothetical protein